VVPPAVVTAVSSELLVIDPLPLVSISLNRLCWMEYGLVTLYPLILVMAHLLIPGPERYWSATRDHRTWRAFRKSRATPVETKFRSEILTLFPRRFRASRRGGGLAENFAG
jgi:hypothetical protein